MTQALVEREGNEVLVAAEAVSKKFCRSLKRSLWYGLLDMASSLVPGGSSTRDASAGMRLRRDEFLALSDVSFELRRGECLGLIGHNGAGKSTLLKVLNSLVPIDGGEITIKGRVAGLLELNAGFNPILTGRENIYNQAALLGFSASEARDKFDSIVDFAEIGDFLEAPVQNYSSGMRVRLGFAVAAHMEPDVLLIDEVLAVGDVAFRFKCLNAIGELMRTAAVIFVTHSMPQVYRLCDELIVLDHGRVKFQGRNIARGVEEYLALFSEAESTVTGSGAVRLTALQTSVPGRSVELGESLVVPFGAQVSISAELAISEEVTTMRVQFLLWNPEMLPVLDIMGSDLGGFEIQVPPGGRVKVSALVPAMNLNGGKYSLSVIAASIDYSSIYCRHDNAAYLQMDASTASGANVLSVAQWTVANIQGH